MPLDAVLVDHVAALEQLPALDEWPVLATADRTAALRDQGSAVRLIVEGRSGQGRGSFAGEVARVLGHEAFVVADVPQATPWPLFWTMIQRHALASGAIPIWRRPPPPRPESARRCRCCRRFVSNRAKALPTTP